MANKKIARKILIKNEKGENHEKNHKESHNL